MSLPGSVKDREYNKFRDSDTGTSVAITGSRSDGVVSVDTAGVQWDQIITTFPSAITELFTYKYLGVTVQTVTVTYESAAKKTVINVVKVRF